MILFILRQLHPCFASVVFARRAKMSRPRSDLSITFTSRIFFDVLDLRASLLLIENRKLNWAKVSGLRLSIASLISTTHSSQLLLKSQAPFSPSMMVIIVHIFYFNSLTTMYGSPSPIPEARLKIRHCSLPIWEPCSVLEQIQGPV